MAIERKLGASFIVQEAIVCPKTPIQYEDLLADRGMPWGLDDTTRVIQWTRSLHFATVTEASASDVLNKLSSWFSKQWPTLEELRHLQRAETPKRCEHRRGWLDTCAVSKEKRGDTKVRLTFKHT